MPLYEYQCDQCSHRFELIQKFSDPPAETCPKCGGHVQKLLSSPAIQFKGSGWYITDYARAGQKDGDTSKPKKDGAEPASTDAKSDGKSEPKTEKKTESKPDAKPSGSASTSE